MSENRAGYPIAVMCRALGVSPSGYFDLHTPEAEKRRALERWAVALHEILELIFIKPSSSKCFMAAYCSPQGLLYSRLTKYSPGSSVAATHREFAPLLWSALPAISVGSLDELVGWFLTRVPLDHLPSANITIDAAAVSDGQFGTATENPLDHTFPRTNQKFGFWPDLGEWQVLKLAGAVARFRFESGPF